MSSERVASSSDTEIVDYTWGDAPYMLPDDRGRCGRAITGRVSYGDSSASDYAQAGLEFGRGLAGESVAVGNARDENIMLLLMRVRWPPGSGVNGRLSGDTVAFCQC
ncbi:hypothetical protein GSI_06137 [Ganoderma sinense ZZ0214-1]|uniref:Uncharacterized protein n=1 Tax=Ganoderma sinense ZZ0214-1 TaxID=1077348 RepID=A0A2G8SCD6_9APHY|nr:hypothetical protein GSI_06137 [Ganoderma sinense ZZ0214-1]